ncbi:hypothetical protein DMB90_03110 [Raoultella planticola]|uniref:HTH lacI-type domain-containing protein n=1 Tax=Raoultella planticola TaxID=575 RepID=A0A5P6A9E3_RAOPL|nr:hypothetical protein DMB90_03110 [Raoultella planticola]
MKGEIKDDGKSICSAGIRMSLTRKRRSTGKVTLADVAQLAGVGTMTVSRALRTLNRFPINCAKKSKPRCRNWDICPILPPAHSRPLHRGPSRWWYLILPRRDVRPCLPVCSRYYSPRDTR